MFETLSLIWAFFKQTEDDVPKIMTREIWNELASYEPMQYKVDRYDRYVQNMEKTINEFSIYHQKIMKTVVDPSDIKGSQNRIQEFENDPLFVKWVEVSEALVDAVKNKN